MLFICYGELLITLTAAAHSLRSIDDRLQMVVSQLGVERKEVINIFPPCNIIDTKSLTKTLLSTTGHLTKANPHPLA